MPGVEQKNFIEFASNAWNLSAYRSAWRIRPQFLRDSHRNRFSRRRRLWSGAASPAPCSVRISSGKCSRGDTCTARGTVPLSLLPWFLPICGAGWLRKRRTCPFASRGCTKRPSRRKAFAPQWLSDPGSRRILASAFDAASTWDRYLRPKRELLCDRTNYDIHCGTKTGFDLKFIETDGSRNEFQTP